MNLSRRQKKLLKKQILNTPLPKIAANLEVSEKDLATYIKKNWSEAKIQKIADLSDELAEKIKNFHFLNWFKSNWEFLLILALLVWGVYFNALHNEFLSDDIATIRDDPSITQLSSVKYTNFPYVIFPRFIEHVMGTTFGVQPTSFRLANVFFQMGAAWSIFLLIGLLFSFPISFFAAAIYAVHPLLTESVSWISGIPYPMGGFFSIIAFILYLMAIYKKNRWYLLSATLSALLAYLSSEKMMVLAISLAFFNLLQPSLRQNKKAWSCWLPFLVLTIIWATGYLGLLGTRINSLTNEYYSSPGLENPLRQVPIAVSTYLELIFFPKNLTFYHSEELLLSPFVFILKSLVFISYFSAVVYSFFKNPKICFWLCFFGISLAVTLTPFRISWIVAERYSYLAVLGIVVVVAYLINELGLKFKKPAISWTLFIIILVALSTRTIVRNFDWKDQDALWLATDTVSPHSHQNHNNLGDLYYRRKEYDKAIEEFQEAINLKSNYGDAYHNMANVYHVIGQDEQAAQNYQKALKFNPNIWQSHLNLAIIYYKFGKFQESIQEMKIAADLNAQNLDIRINLASLYLNSGDRQNAEAEIQKILQIAPNHPKALELMKSINSST